MNNPDFLKICETAASLEMVEILTDGNVRGLDRLAIRTLEKRKQLPNEVVNLMLVYFFNAYANKVYHRNDLYRLYNYWAYKKVYSVSEAKKMMQVDISQILQDL